MPSRSRWRSPRCSWGCPTTASCWRWGWRLGHLFPYLLQQPGYNKRLRRLVPQIARAINYPAFVSPACCDGIRLLDSTPVPLRRVARDCAPLGVAGIAGYGYCRSHTRYFC